MDEYVALKFFKKHLNCVSSAKIQIGHLKSSLFGQFLRSLRKRSAFLWHCRIPITSVYRLDRKSLFRCNAEYKMDSWVDSSVSSNCALLSSRWAPNRLQVSHRGYTNQSVGGVEKDIRGSLLLGSSLSLQWWATTSGGARSAHRIVCRRIRETDWRTNYGVPRTCHQAAGNCESTIPIQAEPIAGKKKKR